MSRLVIKRAAGLHLGANNLGSVPEGAFAKLENCVLQTADTVECRRGFEFIGDYGPGTSPIDSIVFFAGKTLAHYSEDALGYDNGAGWTDIGGAYPPPASTLFRRPRYAYAQRRLYMTSEQGILRMDAFDATPERAGLGSPDVNWNRSFLIADANGPIASNTAVAYRSLVVRRDVNKLEIVGPPSGRAVFRRPLGQVVNIGNLSRQSGVSDVITNVPHGLRTGDTFEVLPGGDAPNTFYVGTYTVSNVPSPTSFSFLDPGPDETTVSGWTYTLGQARADLQITLPPDAKAGDLLRTYRSVATLTAADEPQDDLFLVSEIELESGDITAGYVAVSDKTPSGILGTSSLGYFSASAEKITQSNLRAPFGRELAFFDQNLWVGNLNEPQRLNVRLVATGGADGIGLGGGPVPDESLTFTSPGQDTFSVTASQEGEGGAPGSGDFIIFEGGDVFDDNEKTALSIVNAVNEHALNNWLKASYTSGFNDLPGLMSFEMTADSAASGEETFTVTTNEHPQAFVPLLTDVVSSNERRKARVRWSKLGLSEAFPLENYLDVGDEDEELLRLVPLGERLYVLKEHSLWIISGGRPYRCDQVGGPIAFIGADTPAILGGRIFALTTLGVVAISESGIELIGLPIEEGTRTVTGDLLETTKAYAFGAGDEGGGRYILALPTEEDSFPSHAYVWNALGGGWSEWPKVMHHAAVSPYDSKLYIAAGYGETGQRIARERKTLTRADYQDELGEGIPCVVQWQTQHMGAPEAQKQVSVLKLLFRRFEAMAATLSVETEKSRNPVSQPILRPAYETGEAFAGSLMPYNVRLTPPREKGIAVYFDVSFAIEEAQALWKLQGLHIEYEAYNEKEPR